MASQKPRAWGPTNAGRRLGKADLLLLARALGDEGGELADESIGTIFARCLDRAHELNAPAKLFDGRPPHPKVSEWCGELMDYAAERRREMIEQDNRDAEKWAWYTVYGIVRASTGRPCGHNFAPGSHVCTRVFCNVHIDEIEVDATCDHEFVGKTTPPELLTDSKTCLRCGVSASILQGKHRRELERLNLAAGNDGRAQARGGLPPLGLPPLAMVEDRSAEQLAADGDGPCDHAGELTIDRATGEETCTDCDDMHESAPAGDRRENAEQWAKTRGSKGAERTE
jgi:hypothetical protein